MIDPNVDGFTYNSQNIFLKSGISSALESPLQAGLIAHELTHAVQFSSGELTASRYMVEQITVGYENNKFEKAPDAMQLKAITALCSSDPEKC